MLLDMTVVLVAAARLNGINIDWQMDVWTEFAWPIAICHADVVVTNC